MIAVTRADAGTQRPGVGPAGGLEPGGRGDSVAHCKDADVLTVSGVVTAQAGRGRGQAADKGGLGALRGMERG